MSWAMNKTEELWNRDEEVQNLRNEEQKHSFSKMA
jgi:hypothetical protein